VRGNTRRINAVANAAGPQDGKAAAATPMPSQNCQVCPSRPGFGFERQLHTMQPIGSNRRMDKGVVQRRRAASVRSCQAGATDKDKKDNNRIQTHAFLREAAASCKLSCKAYGVST